MSKLIKYIKELAKQILLEVISMIIALIKGIYVTLISIYKQFKIKHKGYNLLAIIIGIMTIPYLFWEIYSIRSNIISRTPMFELYFGMWENILEFNPRHRKEIFIKFPLLHIIFFLLGYFFISCLFQIKESLKK